MFTPSNLVAAIDRLPKTVRFDYPEASTKTKVRVVSVTKPIGPIRIERTIRSRDGSVKEEEETMSAPMISRYANSIVEGVPVNIDRVLGASYNTRSSLEALLAHTPEFYLCYPKRIEMDGAVPSIKEGHKHLIWTPKTPHAEGQIHELTVDMTISERPGVDTVYGVVDIPAEFHPELDIEVKRRHIQIQIALAEIGHKLSYRTYIAANDQGVTYKGKPLIALPDVVSNLKEERLLTAYGEAADAARLIDCVWFKNGRLMPAVMEVEHSTGITSGLTRMQKFKNILPPFPSRWVIVGPDEDRAEFIRKSSDSQFKDLDARWFPYSAVEELHNLVHRREIKGVTEEFLDSFIEKAA